MKKLFLCEGQPLSLILLAGGQSRRMKQNKALLPLPGGTLIERILGQVEDHFDEVLISVSEPQPFLFLDRRLIVDPVPDQGPMGGLQSALQAARNERSFAVACDIPNIDLNFLKRMIMAAAEFDAVVPVSSGGRREPLFAVYSRAVLPMIEDLFNSEVRSLLPLLDLCRTKYIRMADSAWFKNLNTIEDYQDFLKRLNQSH